MIDPYELSDYMDSTMQRADIEATQIKLASVIRHADQSVLKEISQMLRRLQSMTKQQEGLIYVAKKAKVK